MDTKNIANDTVTSSYWTCYFYNVSQSELKRLIMYFLEFISRACWKNLPSNIRVLNCYVILELVDSISCSQLKKLMDKALSSYYIQIPVYSLLCTGKEYSNLVTWIKDTENYFILEGYDRILNGSSKRKVLTTPSLYVSSCDDSPPRKVAKVESTSTLNAYDMNTIWESYKEDLHSNVSFPLFESIVKYHASFVGDKKDKNKG